MDGERPDEKTIFNEAAEIQSPEQRKSYLDKACGDDAELRSAVEELLRLHDANRRFLEVPVLAAMDTVHTSPVSEGPGDVIGRYKLLEQIGEGGFGVVYMADQLEPVRRRVALKIIKLGMDTKVVITRFEAERQALAMMEHPNIARVLDAGATETGRPYFVMELVKGIPITQYCDQNDLSTSQRLDLFTQVCSAVQHAHQKGIIHRDIKPTNVLVTLYDGEPVPKVIDFGIAKAMGRPLTDRTLFTAFGKFVGTPQYMSPEQAALSGVDVDTRSDIYCLGVLLYELLTGTTPFEADTLRSAAYDEICRIIREVEPPKPSTRISTMGDRATEVAKHRDTEPAALGKLIRGDLDWIVMKALEKDRTRRYETPTGLAQDIQRHLSEEPVIAGPPSAAYRLRKFVRRNRLAVTAGALVVASLVLGLSLATVGFVRASRERAEALHQRNIAQQNAQKAVEAERSETEQRDRAEAARAAEAEERALAERILFVAGLPLTFAGSAFGPDGNLYIACRDTSSVLRVDSETGRLLGEFVRPGGGGLDRPGSLAFGPDRNGDNVPDLYITSWGTGRGTGAILCYDGASGEFIVTFVNSRSGGRTSPTGLVFGPQEDLYVGCSATGGVLRFDGRTGQYLGDFVSRGSGGLKSPGTLVFGPDGNLYVTNPAGNNVLTYDGHTGAFLREFVTRGSGGLVGPGGLAFGPEGQLHVASRPGGRRKPGGYRGEVLRYQGETGHFIDAFISRGQGGDLDGQTVLFDKKGRLYVTNYWAENVLRYNGKTGEFDRVLVSARHLRHDLIALRVLSREGADESDRRSLAVELATIAWEYARRGEKDVASEAGKSALALEPGSADVQRRVGGMFRLLRMYEEAERCFSKAIDLEPDNAGLRRDRVWLYVITEEYDKAIADCSVVVELEPDNAQPRLDRAGWYLKTEQYDKALADYSAAIELEPDNAGPRLHRARLYRETKEYDKALADYSAAIDLEPYNAQPRLQRAEFYLETKEYDKAFADYSAAIELEPDNAYAWCRRGRAHAQLGQFEKALADYSAAIELQPNFLTPLYWRGQAHAELGQFEKAALDFAKAADLRPDDAVARYFHALVRLALSDAGGYRGTCASMLESFGQTEDPKVANWVAWTCVLAPDALEDPGQAVRLARKAVGSDEQSDSFLDTLGAALYRAGQFEEAIKRLTELHARRDDTQGMMPSIFFLAMAHHQEGHFEESRKWLSRAVERADQEITDKPLWNRQLTLNMLRREAEALLGLPEQATPGGKEVAPGEK